MFGYVLNSPTLSCGDMTEPSWPDPGAVALDVPLPEGVRVRQLARGDVPALIATLDAWDPELRQLDRAALTPASYDEAAAFAGEDAAWGRRPVLVIAFEQAKGPVAYLILACERRDFLACELGEGTLAVRLSAVHPQQRGRGLERALVELAVQVAKATPGMTLLYQSIALDDRPASAQLERAGFRPWAVLPNGGLRRVGSALLHVPQALWIELLVDPRLLCRPDPDKLRPRTAALAQLLFDEAEVATPRETTTAALPELEPALAVRLAARPGGRDTWPDIGELAASLALPPGVVVRALARAELPHVLEQLPVWYPPLLHATTDFLTPASYERVALAGEEARVDRRPGFALVAEVDGELAVFASYTFRADRARRLKAELAVVNPEYRRKNLSNHLTPLWVLIARALEADTIVRWATLSHPHTQLACERQGLALVGLLPTERWVDAQGVTRLVCEALYAASLVPDAQRLDVPLNAMPASVAALARFVGS